MSDTAIKKGEDGGEPYEAAGAATDLRMKMAVALRRAAGNVHGFNYDYYVGVPIS